MEGGGGGGMGAAYCKCPEREVWHTDTMGAQPGCQEGTQPCNKKAVSTSRCQIFGIIGAAPCGPLRTTLGAHTCTAIWLISMATSAGDSHPLLATTSTTACSSRTASGTTARWSCDMSPAR